MDKRIPTYDLDTFTEELVGAALLLVGSGPDARHVGLLTGDTIFFWWVPEQKQSPCG